MSTRNTPPEPEHNTTTDRPGPFQRVGNALAWYTPELAVAAASAGAAATVWAPLGVITAACGARIASHQINLARANRRVRREIEQERAEHAQLDNSGKHEPGESSDDTPHDGDGPNAGESTSAEQTGERPGWEVSA